MPEVMKRLSLARQIDKIMRKDSKVSLAFELLYVNSDYPIPSKFFTDVCFQFSSQSICPLWFLLCVIHLKVDFGFYSFQISAPRHKLC